jgi:hypothetical protein
MSAQVKFEDEMHFLMFCSKYDKTRQDLFSIVGMTCINFQNLSIEERFLWLMTCENDLVLKKMCQFICKYCRWFFFLSDIYISSCSCEGQNFIETLWETIFSSSSWETPNRILPNLAHLLILFVFTSVLCGVNKEVKENNNNNKKPNPILAFLAHLAWAIAITWHPSSSSVCRTCTSKFFSKIFSSETTWPIETKLGLNHH